MYVNMSLIRQKLPGDKVDFLKNMTSIRNGIFQDCFTYPGRPVAGSFTANTTVGTFYSSASTGALSFIKSTGSIYSIGSKCNSFDVDGFESPVIILYDRVWAVSFLVNTISEQSFTLQDYGRYQGEDLSVWVEMIADSTSLTDRTLTLKYINQNNQEVTSDTLVRFSSLTGNVCDTGNIHFLGLANNDKISSIKSVKMNGTVGSVTSVNLVVGKILNITTSSPQDNQNTIFKNGVVNIHSSSCLSFMTLWSTAPNTTTDTIMPIFNFVTI